MARLANIWKFFPIITVVILLLVGCKGKQSSLNLAVIGKPAPDFTLTDTVGKPWALSDLQGKVVLVNFWATWCPPCRQEMPSMMALHRELTGSRFQMITILVNDDPNQAIIFARKAGLTFPILVDANDEAGSAYGLTGVPETFIIDGQGILREKVIGPRNWNTPESKRLIQRYMP